MKKKAWLIAVSAVLALALAVTGTIAYLTDRDSEVNVFTWGNVDIVLNEDFEQAATLVPGVDIEKEVTISNVGKSDAWVWTKIAIPAALDNEDASKNVIHFNYAEASVAAGEWTWTKDGNWIVDQNIDINGVAYNVYTVLYQTALKSGDVTETSAMTKVYLDKTVDIDPDGNLHKVVNGVVTDIDWNINEDGTPMIYVSAYATQAAGFDTVYEAYDAYATQWGDKSEIYSDPVVVASNAQELREALVAGKDVILSEDITDLDADSTITIAAGKNVTLNLNGHKIDGQADDTENREMFLVKGNMTVVNGEIALTATVNQEWDAMATIFDVTAGGVLNLDGVTATVGGTDMNFIVHLNNWGEVTLNVNNCDFTASYVAVRAFNSGYDMNYITIENTEFHDGRVFWVHNYTSEGKNDSTLDLNIYGNGNTTDNEKPIRFGFSNSVYYDINGNVVA